MFGVYFIMQMSNGCRLTWFKWVNSIFLFTLIIQTATKKKKKALKTNLGNLFLSPTLPTSQTTANTCYRRREPHKPGSQGWVLLLSWVHSSCRSRCRSGQHSPGCPRPRAKNDSRPVKFSGSWALTNGANLNRQNTFLAQGHATALNGKACCPLTPSWQPGCSCVNTLVRKLPLKSKDTGSGHLLPIVYKTH